MPALLLLVGFAAEDIPERETNGLVPIRLSSGLEVQSRAHTGMDAQFPAQSWLNANKNNIFLPVSTANGPADPLNNIQGYNNTKATEAFNAANADNTVTAVAEAVAYRTKVPAPQNSSDWYLPSAKELTLLCGKETSNIWTNGSGGTANRDLINAQLLPIGGAIQISKENYWSGTEFESDRAWYVNFSDGKVGYSSKRGASYRVRPVLAF